MDNVFPLFWQSQLKDLILIWVATQYLRTSGVCDRKTLKWGVQAVCWQITLRKATNPCYYDRVSDRHKCLL